MANIDVGSVILGYQIKKVLGSGGFGIALLVKDRHGNNKVLKRIGPLTSRNERENAKKEANLLSRIHHPHIVQFYDSFDIDQYLFIVMEYCEGGDLGKYINAYEISEDQVIMWLKQLSEAIHFLHSNRVLHRDIKPQNIFCKNDEIKLGDFGISKILSKSTSRAYTAVGTQNYLSPEQIKEIPYNEKTDIWSLGCVLYEMCSSEPAFEGSIGTLADEIRSGRIPRLPDDYSRDLSQIYESMLQQDPQRRPSAKEILNYLKRMQQQEMSQLQQMHFRVQF